MNKQCVVYRFSCDLCDADYVGYTARHLHQRMVAAGNLDLCDTGYVGFTRRHLHQRVDKHRHTSSSIGKHFRDKHSSTPKDLTTTFTILKKCNSKFDCFIYEMFFINELRPSPNVQRDSIRAKVFKYSFLFILFLYVLFVFNTPLFNIFMLLHLSLLCFTI